MKDYTITNKSVAQLIEDMHIPEWVIKTNINTALEEQHEYVNFTCYPNKSLNDVVVEYTIPTKYFKKVEPKEEEDSYAVIECIRYLNSNFSEEDLEEFITTKLIPYDEMVSISLEDPWLIEDKQYIGYDSSKKHILFFKGKDWGQVLNDYPNADYVPFTNEIYENFSDLIKFIEEIK